MRSRYPQSKALTQASSPADAHKIITDTLPPLVSSVLSTADVEQMREKLTRITAVPLSPQLRRNDWLGGVVVSLIVVLATLPVLVPLAVIEKAKPALRVSNGIAIVMLFLTGYAFGRHAGHRPLAMGICMVILGGAMVAVTISLGG